jgi:hypothetical protein
MVNKMDKDITRMVLEYIEKQFDIEFCVCSLDGWTSLSIDRIINNIDKSKHELWADIANTDLFTVKEFLAENDRGHSQCTANRKDGNRCLNPAESDFAHCISNYIKSKSDINLSRCRVHQVKDGK